MAFNNTVLAQFFEALFTTLYRRCAGPARGHGFRFKNKLFSPDGSLIDLSMKVFPWADYNRKKVAFKLHVGLDHDGLIPAFAAVTLGKDSETAQARKWDFPAGSVMVFDKGYNRYAWHNALTEKGLIRVTRIRGNALYRVAERRTVAPDANATSDRVIRNTPGRKPRKTACRRYAGLAIAIRKRTNTTSSSPINLNGPHRPSPISIDAPGVGSEY